ncbi:transposase [Streptomyces sp. NPDC005799]|uniref:transposase n=1 Tax=Streptomyces sp. NPDC005799 TaxID=3154678 RepID=UPI0033CEB9CE
MAEDIEEIFNGSGGTYGSPKVFVELGRRGWRVSVDTVAKVMAELGLAGRKEGPPTPVTDQAGQAARGPGLRPPGLHRRGARPRLGR